MVRRAGAARRTAWHSRDIRRRNGRHKPGGGSKSACCRVSAQSGRSCRGGADPGQAVPSAVLLYLKTPPAVFIRKRRPRLAVASGALVAAKARQARRSGQCAKEMLPRSKRRPQRNPGNLLFLSILPPLCVAAAEPARSTRS